MNEFFSEDKGESIYTKIAATASVIVIIVGGIVWLTDTNLLARANQKSLSQMKLEGTVVKDRVFDRLNSLDQKVSRILGMLEVMEENTRQQRKPRENR